MTFSLREFKSSDPYVTTCRLMTAMEAQMLPPREGHARFIVAGSRVAPVIEAPNVDTAVDYAFRFKLITAYRAAICFTTAQDVRLVVEAASKADAIDLLALGSALSSADPAAAQEVLSRLLPTSIGRHTPAAKNIWRMHTTDLGDAPDVTAANFTRKYYAGAWENPIRVLLFQ